MNKFLSLIDFTEDLMVLSPGATSVSYLQTLKRVSLVMKLCWFKIGFIFCVVTILLGFKSTKLSFPSYFPNQFMILIQINYQTKDSSRSHVVL